MGIFAGFPGEGASNDSRRRQFSVLSLTVSSEALELGIVREYVLHFFSKSKRRDFLRFYRASA